MNQEENLQKRKAFTEGTLNLNMLSTLQLKKKKKKESGVALSQLEYLLPHTETNTHRPVAFLAAPRACGTSAAHKLLRLIPRVTSSETNSFSGQLRFPSATSAARLRTETCDSSQTKEVIRHSA